MFTFSSHVDKVYKQQNLHMYGAICLILKNTNNTVLSNFISGVSLTCLIFLLWRQGSPLNLVKTKMEIQSSPKAIRIMAEARVMGSQKDVVTLKLSINLHNYFVWAPREDIKIQIWIKVSSVGDFKKHQWKMTTKKRKVI